jgi:hypothetical protein
MSKKQRNGKSERERKKQRQRKEKKQKQKKQKSTRKSATRAAKGGGPEPSPDYIRELNRSEVPDWIQSSDREAEFSQDMILGNLKEEEVHEQKFLMRVRRIIQEASHPPEESVLQGGLREAVMDDDKTALDGGDINALLGSEASQFARISRSRGGWQQKIVSEQQQVVRREDDRERNSGGGVISKLLGGGK